MYLYALASFVCVPAQVDDELEIKAYYAGHVLGAAMFQVKVGQNSVVYTVSSRWVLVSLSGSNIAVQCF